MIVDFHTHAFPDALAERAIPALEEEADVKAHLDGRVSSLVGSMDRSGVDRAVVASIATKPSQFRSIFTWSQSIATERIIPFPSVHPEDVDIASHLGEIVNAGFPGIKLHPYYQEFSLDEPRMIEVFELIQEAGLIVLLHTGYDIAYARIPIADPEKIAFVHTHVPGLRLVTTHFGAWEDWDGVEKYLLGKEIYMDTSYSIPLLGKRRARRFLLNHPEEFLIFGSDSPWGSQAEDIQLIKALDLGESKTKMIMGGNAQRLLRDA